MVTKRRNKSHRKRQLVFALLLVTFILAGTGLYLKLKKSTIRPTSNQASTITNKATVNYNPPTQADIEQTDQHKNDITNPPSNTTQPSGSKKTVTPMVTAANNKTVNAYVLGVFEDGGICTAKVTQGSLRFSRTSEGFENSSYTQCTPLDISSGGVDATQKWSLTISYSSTTAEGTSSVATITP